MNLLGKLFIVMIFIGSIMFASFSVVIYATHRNWRDDYIKVEANLQTAQQRLADAERQKASMEAALRLEVRSLQDLNISLSDRVRQLSDDNERERAEIARLTEALQEQIALVAVSHEMAEGLRTQLDATNRALLEAQNEWVAMSTELIKKIDEAHSLAIRLSNYQTTAANLAEEFRKAMQVLQLFGLLPDPSLYPEKPPAGTHGIVTEVRPGGWVEVSIGVDSGLARGHQLDVVRNRDGRSVLVGKIEVTDPIADRAVARVMPEFRLGVVQRGDEVMYIEVGGLTAVH